MECTSLMQVIMEMVLQIHRVIGCITFTVFCILTLIISYLLIIMMLILLVYHMWLNTTVINMCHNQEKFLCISHLLLSSTQSINML